MEHEGVIAEAEQPIDAAHHARRGAPVGIEGVVRGNVAARFHIGKDIGAAKGVDGLLRSPISSRAVSGCRRQMRRKIRYC